MYQFIHKAGPADSTVLILGESGTGKELVARAIHRNSTRPSGPFVAVNCGAIAPGLIENELFGHEKGAFTGAVSQRKGKIETADGGTLFLDEIGELPMPMQTALLRVLQEREFERVGGNHPVQVDVRVIAATNRNLEQAIKEGRFRQDLFFRLQVLAIKMPSLSERREDIQREKVADGVPVFGPVEPPKRVCPARIDIDAGREVQGGLQRNHYQVVGLLVRTPHSRRGHLTRAKLPDDFLPQFRVFAHGMRADLIKRKSRRLQTVVVTGDAICGDHGAMRCDCIAGGLLRFQWIKKTIGRHPQNANGKQARQPPQAP